MKLLKWFKENVFDWSSETPVYRGHRPPTHHPGYKNIKKQKVKKPKSKKK